MKKLSLIGILFIFSFMATAYTQTADVPISVNVTIRYYGNTSDYVLVSVYGANHSYSLSNSTHNINYNNPYNYSYSCIETNITEACGEISDVCSNFADYLNDTTPYLEKYANEKAERARVREALDHQSEKRGKCENDTIAKDAKIESYERYANKYEICQVKYEICSDDLVNQTSLTELAENARLSWGFGGAIIIGAIGYALYRIKGPRKPEEDIKEDEVAEEPK